MADYVYEKIIPRLKVREMTYGEYLTEQTKVIPDPAIPFEERGFYILETTAPFDSNDVLPFRVGDWVQRQIITHNYRRIEV